MNNKALPIITINREYGAGGRALADILSEKLNIPYYDKDFIAKTMDESGFDREDVEREGEEMSKASRVFKNFLSGTVSFSSSHDAIYNAEKKVVLDLAKNPCIMVGRCANRILDEAGIENISIYLHAPADIRLKRTIELGAFGDMDPEKFMEIRDSQRRTFYNQYTGCDLTDATYYTFCFDVGRISIPQCGHSS